ncbi:GDP-mannose-dependent alpha-(1-6)-phosphatidylinositol monomannoside mannosyltransferase [mine drainage metagenome]|uniref:GDP-mannose-dependent alpha-(1-6)-phosphatidylinositol monomannoside mannosyltransferase n=1 Tax=mine drainage metagenome TaxID=410659 RepID=A0A1J5SGH7_9ZZZZ
MKILILGSASSIHTTNWVQQLSTFQNVEIKLLSCHPITQKFPYSVHVKMLKYKPGIGYILNLIEVLYEIKNFSPDYLHSLYATGYGLLGTLCFFKSFLISVWGSDVLIFPEKSVIHKYFLKSILNRAISIGSTSICMRKKLMELEVKNDIYLTPFGIDIDKFCNANNRSNEVITIGTIKSLERVYGIDIMIKAFPQIKKMTTKSIRVLIYGNGSDIYYLKSLTKQLELTNEIHFMGAVAHENVPEILNSLNIFFSMSRSESFGVSTLEASACGLPVIVSDACGMLEVVDDNITGFIIKNNSQSSLIDKFITLIEDEKLRKKMGNAGRDFVIKNFESVRLKNNIYNFYHRFDV